MKTFFKKLDVGAKFKDIHGNIHIRITAYPKSVDSIPRTPCIIGSDIFTKFDLNAVLIDVHNTTDDFLVPGMCSRFKPEEYVGVVISGQSNPRSNSCINGL